MSNHELALLIVARIDGECMAGDQLLMREAIRITEEILAAKRYPTGTATSPALPEVPR